MVISLKLTMLLELPTAQINHTQASETRAKLKQSIKANHQKKLIQTTKELKANYFIPKNI
jgi:hypothetical protein